MEDLLQGLEPRAGSAKSLVDKPTCDLLNEVLSEVLVTYCINAFLIISILQLYVTKMVLLYFLFFRLASNSICVMLNEYIYTNARNGVR